MEKTEATLIFMILSMCIMITGIAFNFLAIQGNGGKMPVLAPYEVEDYSPKHFTFYNFDEVKYPYYSDVLSFSYGKWGYFFSWGDVLMTFGLVCFALLGGRYTYLKLTACFKEKGWRK